MQIQARYCGPCTLCCLVLDIPELGKKAGEWCEHCTDEGCSIYEDRPEVCRGFHCVWQMMPKSADKKNEYRPDKFGVVMIHKEDIQGYSPAIQFNAPDKDHLNTSKVEALVRLLTCSGKNIGLVSVKGDVKDRLVLARNCHA